jgi:hypothetical protein
MAIMDRIKESIRREFKRSAGNAEVPNSPTLKVDQLPYADLPGHVTPETVSAPTPVSIVPERVRNRIAMSRFVDPKEKVVEYDRDQFETVAAMRRAKNKAIAEGMRANAVNLHPKPYRGVFLDEQF